MARAPATSFTDLEVWQSAHRFVLDVYQCTQTFPKEERFGLVSQFRRVAVSVPANIAEGFRKRSAADKARFLNISEGSFDECRYYLILAHDLHYVQDTQVLQKKLDEVARLLHGYSSAIRRTAQQIRNP